MAARTQVAGAADSALTPAQRRALAHVRDSAARAVHRADGRLALLRGESRHPDQVARAVRNRGRVALHFHPDRLLANGRTVGESVLAEGLYRNQFETRVSNGGLTAFPGGDRDRWEEGLFGGAFQARGVGGRERPKYGALDLFRHADGPAPRFGSCYLRLRPEVLNRCTFSCGDSYLGPTDVCTWDVMEPVLAGLLEAVDAGGWTLGHGQVDVETFVRLLMSEPICEPFTDWRGRSLDEYIEVHVHGDVSLAEDVEWLIADPSFAGTSTEGVLEAIAARFDVALAWHPGFELCIDVVPDDFRGPAIPVLARRLEAEFLDGRSRLNAAVIGRAAASVHREPERWSDWASPADTLQQLKQLWHALVRYGE
jgi:hypothetical protein